MSSCSELERMWLLVSFVTLQLVCILSFSIAPLPAPLKRSNAQVELNLIKKIYAKGLSLKTLGGLSAQRINSKEEVMLLLGSAFKLWCRARAVDSPPLYWSMDLIGRDSMKKYPVLHSNIKASQAKIVLFFASDLAAELAQLCPCDSTFIRSYRVCVKVVPAHFRTLRSRMHSPSELRVWFEQLPSLH